MSIGKSISSISVNDILSKISELDILSKYLGIKKIPCIINSPLRKDNNPSFGIYSKDGKRVYYKDFSTKEHGGILDLLCRLWGKSLKEVLIILDKDIPKNLNINVKKYTSTKTSGSVSNSILKVKIRNWELYDLKYWESFGITLEWLKFAEVYPISHKIIIKNNNKYVFKADKYAYAYIEHKENKESIKIYQPFNKCGYKWSSNIDRSVWSLWTKIPKFGNNLIISSSVKDCLNIMCNLGIPAICMQGEGYKPKPQIIEELKSRYKNIILFYDNDYNNPDNPGKKDSMELSLEYNLKRVEIPEKYESKDPSDLFKKYGRDRYLEIMNEILKDLLWKSGEV